MSLIYWPWFRFAAPQRRHDALHLEILEDRLVLSSSLFGSAAPIGLNGPAAPLARTAFWINPAGGDWDNKHNWQGNYIPQAGDAAFINFAGIVVTHVLGKADAVQSLQCAATLDISKGSLSIGGGTSSLADLDLSGSGVLAGASDVTVTQSFTWAGGTLGGGGTLTAGQLILDGGAKTLDGRTLINQGGGDWYGGALVALDGGQFVNAAGAAFTIQTADSFAAPFVNAGTLVIAANSTSNLTGALVNSGAVFLQGGLLNVGRYAQSAGSVHLAGGTIASANLVEIDGGALTGWGTIQANVLNAGQISPNGVLIVAGDYTQANTGVLAVGLAGAHAGQYDQLVTGGAASLSGTLKIFYVNGFAPSPGDKFAVVTYGALAGGFTTISGLKSSNGTALTAIYGPTVLTLIAPVAASSGGGGNQGGGGGVNNGSGGGSNGGGASNNGGGANSGLNGGMADNTQPVIAKQPDASLPLAQAAPRGGATAANYQDFFTAMQASAIEVYRAVSSNEDNVSAQETSPEHATESSKARTGGAGIAGADSGDFSAMADDELLAKLFTSGNVLDGFSDEDLLPALDLAGVLLIGGRPRADILPQRGQQASPLTTLVTDDGDPTRGAVVPGIDTPLLDLLIDPTGPSFRRLPVSPAPTGRPPIRAASEKTAAVPAFEWRPFLLAGVLPLWWSVRRAINRPRSRPRS